MPNRRERDAIRAMGHAYQWRTDNERNEYEIVRAAYLTLDLFAPLDAPN